MIREEWDGDTYGLLNMGLGMAWNIYLALFLRDAGRRWAGRMVLGRPAW